MNDRIAQSLEKLFDNHRIIFWYDAKEEFRSEFDSCNLPKVENLEIKDNEFAIKYRILREQPKQKFLLYKPDSEPVENWLLDVQLANTTFRADREALMMSELGLDRNFSDLVKEHFEFFRAKKRQEALQKFIADGGKKHGDIRRKMLAICTGNDSFDLKSVLLTLIQELADEKSEMIELIGRCSLEPFLWEEVKRYGYQSSKSGVKDFVYWLFKNGITHITTGTDSFSPDARVFFADWKDSNRFKKSFKQFSDEYAEKCDLRDRLDNKDFRELVDFDYFQVIDRLILRGLSKSTTARSHVAEELLQIIKTRRQKHWFDEFKHHYFAIESAIHFFKALHAAHFEINDFGDGIKKYCSSWFRLDQHYRNFVFHCRKAAASSLFQNLDEDVENHYVNTYLRKVNDLWQSHIDSCSKWHASGFVPQYKFFEEHVLPLLKKGRICVIISDALRYEVAEELTLLISQKNCIHAELKPMLAMLPSYTGLGMAALLPNETLEISDTDVDTVLVDGQSSKGTANRTKILQTSLPDRTTQILKLEELLLLNGKQLAERLKDYQITYIYHNRIDKVGDDRDSESRLCDAVEETKGELFKMVEKLKTARVSNVLITTDHGFIYQNRELDESEFSSLEANGEHILSSGRRFVVGKNLQAAPAFRRFSADELGLAGNIEVLIPKSILRLRLQGAGSRYVHGGASLQEVVLPVVGINCREENIFSFVDVQVINKGRAAITTGQLTVTFYQEQTIKDNVMPHPLRIGFYNESGKPVSNIENRPFDIISDNPKDREIKITFFFDSSEIDQLNKQKVFLKLKETVGGTSQERDYRSFEYDVKPTLFTDDFF